MSKQDKKITVVTLYSAPKAFSLEADGITIETVTLKCDVSTHYHMCYELEFLVEGEVLLQINGKKHHTKKGGFWLSLPSDIHKIDYLGESSTIISIKFSEKVLSRDMYERLDMLQNGFFHSFSERDFEDWREAYRFFMRKQAELSGSAKTMFLRSALELSLSYMTEFFAVMPSPTASASFSRIYKAVEYIKKHFKEPFDVGKIADDLNYSVGYLSSKFKELTGRTPVEFVNNERLRFAYYLISTTDMYISEVSDYVGFSSLSYFTKMFKRRYGCAPTEIKKSKNNTNLT